MNIPIKTNKDFEKAMYSLSEKYGEDFEILNGLHNSQLNFSDFIDGFVDKNVADATIDANANAATKDIRSLLGEKGKSLDKLFAFNKIFYEFKKKYGLRAAKEWLETEYNGGFYLHDAPTSTYIPYCFRGDTKILTKRGVKRLDDLVGQDILVLGKNHGWEPATVKHFGRAILYKLTLERCNRQKVIYTTANHLWFVKNKSLVPTEDLKPGMQIPFNTCNTWVSVEPSPFGVAHGFFTGDGDKGSHMRANFCGAKTALLPYFTPAKVSGTEKEYTTCGVPNYFKELPDLNESVSYLYGWLAGYFAADGCVDDRGRCSISSCKRETLEYTRDVLCVLGMPVNTVKYQDRVSNLTGEMGRVYTLYISPECLSDNFFIRPDQRERFHKLTEVRKNRSWIVKSVENTGVEDDVYCAEVPGTASFTLDGNVLTHNCYAYDLTRLATEGLFFLNNYNHQPPKHLTTFLDDTIEYVSYFANRSSGAVGLPNILIWTYYFWKKDCESGHYIKDPKYYIRQCFQKFIYRLNQPFMRVDQTAFVNVSIFDRNYIEALFGGVEYPDGTYVIDCVEDLIEHQKLFMEVVSEIRSENMFTFPILSYSLLFQNGKFVDEPFARWCSDHNTMWNDSNFFTSNDVTTLSNCPMSADTKIAFWSSTFNKFTVSAIKDVYHRFKESDKEPIQVLSNGKLIRCKINKFDIKPEYNIKLVNGASLKTTGNHLNKVFGKDYVQTKDLTTDDYLPYTLTPYEGNGSMTYEDGKLVGMFLGNGSYRNYNDVVFSMNNITGKEDIEFVRNYCVKRFNAKVSENVLTSSISGKQSCININIVSPYVRGLISQFVVGDNALTKAIDTSAMSCSMEFRRGIVDGLYATDGGNNNRIYTSSEALRDSLVLMFASMGIVTTVREDNRENRLGTNTNYSIRWYTPNDRTKLKGVYKIDNGMFWVKIDSVAKFESKCSASYCLEVIDSDVEPVFMLANGIHTHNCRLLSDTSKLSGFINSIGGTALSIGSVKVNTINLVRIALETDCDENRYLEVLRSRAELCCKTLDVVRHIIKRNVEKGLLPNYQDGGIEMDKQYCTIGILGLYEAVEAFGYIKTDEFGYVSYTDEGIEFASKIFDVLNSVKDGFTNEYSFNIESVPAERAAVILCQKDNLLYERNEKFIYSNQWIPLSVKCSIKDKLYSASILDRQCSGGSIAHINLDANFPNKDMAWDMLNRVAQSGVIYFAFNTRINECKNHHGFVGTDHCPVCGEPVFDTYVRIVGYLVPTRNFSKDRKREFTTRQWYDYAACCKE